MKTYTTTIKAICPKTGELKEYAGPNVPGISVATAQEYCVRSGLAYCQVTGVLVEEISLYGDETQNFHPDGFSPN